MTPALHTSIFSPLYARPWILKNCFFNPECFGEPTKVDNYMHMIHLVTDLLRGQMIQRADKLSAKNVPSYNSIALFVNSNTNTVDRRNRSQKDLPFLKMPAWPKSAIFKLPRLSSNRFSSLRSRWHTPCSFNSSLMLRINEKWRLRQRQTLSWQYWRPSMSWTM